MAYWVIFPVRYDDGIVLSAVPDGGPKAYEYDKGKPLVNRFPKGEDAVMCLDLEFTDRTGFYDILPSLDTVMVLNSKVKSLFEHLGVGYVEYLPITLWDQERGVLSNDYFIANALGSVDLIDMEKTEFVPDRLIEGQINFIHKLVIKEDVDANRAKFFRATTKLDLFFIHDDVRKALESAGITGYKLYPADGWDGLDI